MFEEREIVSPATPGWPEERATPVVLSGGASSVGLALLEAIGVSPSRYARSPPLGPHPAMNAASAADAAAVMRCRCIWITRV
jgi:hypothetical protein